MIEDRNKKLWTIFQKSEEKLLRRRAGLFDFSRYTKKDVEELIRFMRSMMVKHHGVGLSANQIGLDMQVFVAQLPATDGKGYTGKFYAIFNPTLTILSKKEKSDQEGCLSVPGYFGETSRSDRVEVKGFDKNKRPIVIKASGFLARIFQHECDHLNGKLFTDNAKHVVKVDETTVTNI